MIGLVLEGGGAKGAYHVGAIKALYDNGYSFDGIAGTSIGAINGAMVIQEDDYATCLDMWTNIQPSDIADINNEALVNLFRKKFDKETVKYWIVKFMETIRTLGFPTDKIKPFLNKYIDENKIRKSGKDFAIVTFCISDRKPLELHLDDIPEGQLLDFIFASAYFPLFKLNRINGKYYIDGGIYDNLPINALIRKNKYDEIIAIRTGSKIPLKPVLDNAVVIKTIAPRESLGNLAELDKDRVNYNIKLGYYDALRMLNSYKGHLFYFEDFDYGIIDNMLLAIPQKKLDKICDLLRLKKGTDKVGIINSIYYHARKGNIELTDKEAFIAFLENYALSYGMDKFKVYKFDEFLEELKQSFYLNKEKSNDKKISEKKLKNEKLFEILITELNTEEL